MIAACLTKINNDFSTELAMDIIGVLLKDDFDITEFKVMMNSLDTCQNVTDTALRNYILYSSASFKQ